MSSITNGNPNSNKTANPNFTKSTKDFVEKRGVEIAKKDLIFSQNQNMSSNSNTIITKEMASVKNLKQTYKDFIKDEPKKVKMMKDFAEKIKGKNQPQRKAQYRKLMEKYEGWEKRVKKTADEESVSSFGSVEEIEQEQQIEDVKEEPTISFTSSCDESSEEELEIEEEIDQDQELKELVEKMEKKEEIDQDQALKQLRENPLFVEHSLLDALKEEEIVVEQFSWIEGIGLSEAVFNTLSNEVKRVMIDDVKERNRLREELTKNTTKHFHAKRKGEKKRKAKSSKSEVYEVWSHLSNNGVPPDWFKHTLQSEDEGGVVDEWHFDYNRQWDHYEVNWEKSSTKIPKASLSYNTFLTANENHKKATHKYISAFNNAYALPISTDPKWGENGAGLDDKVRAKALQQKYKALSKPTFTFPPIDDYDEAYEEMKKAKETTKKTEKTKKKK